MNAAYILFILIIIASNGFFNPFGFMEERTIKAWFYGISIIAFLYSIINKKSIAQVPKIKGYLTILLLSILTSAIMASAFHPQPLIVSFVSVAGNFFAYLSLYTLLNFQLDQDKIMRFLLAICLLSVCMYICNAYTFPYEMFGGYNEIRDGDDIRGARVTVPMLNGMVILVFYGLQKIMDEKRYIWLIYVSIFSVVIVLSLWRQVMLLTVLISSFYILSKFNWTKRIIFGIICVLFVCFVLPKIPLYQTLVEVTEMQAEDNMEDEDIRIYDYKYFCDIYQTNNVTRILGNGAPSFGNSAWGNQVENEWAFLGTFPTDVGWAAFYWTYGAIATLVFLIILYKSFKTASGNRKLFIRMSIVYFVAESIANGPILYIRDITLISLILFLANSNLNDKLINRAPAEIQLHS